MRRLTYENARGERIVFYLSPILIESLTGIGEVDADLQGQKSPYQDGETHLDVILQPRFIDLEGSILKTDLREMKAYRKHILKVCNPKLGLGKITLELDGDTKEIFGVLDGTPSFPERGRDVWQKFLITWKCPDPYWRDPQEVSRALRSYRGKFILPTTFPFELGISGDSTILYNGGDVDAPVTIDIQGPVTRPRVINKTTGQFVILNRSLSADEVLHINTNDQNKRVEIYRGAETIEKAIGYLDHDSDFWKLEPGDNEIQYIADAGNADAIVAIAWHNHYLGM
ncbi:phage tail family protein [Oceanobacillus kimchii]|uniref:phage tail family protein n=1 Tax=Oceanobacillus kimchii TaxID=746691 RepID=UPI0021A84826|nr:phage tail family protein [Oceanobacillus kimchii]MCT1577530.1 phage tail family protein [Oceanobacillus kimchii]MCT2136518.1 phage tail family protein [Oceanobacillus kimchii]